MLYAFLPHLNALFFEVLELVKLANPLLGHTYSDASLFVLDQNVTIVLLLLPTLVDPVQPVLQRHRDVFHTFANSGRLR